MRGGRCGVAPFVWARPFFIFKRKVTDKMTNYIVTRNGVRVEYRAKNRMELDKQLESFTKLLPNSPPVESIVEGKLPHRKDLAPYAMGRQFGARWIESPFGKEVKHEN